MDCFSVLSKPPHPPISLFFPIFYVVFNLDHKGSEIGDSVTAVCLGHSMASLFKGVWMFLLQYLPLVLQLPKLL